MLSCIDDTKVTGSCSGTFDKMKNEIKSPNYPKNYNNNENCTWRIVASTDSTVVLNYEDFSIENSKNCKYDYLEISDGNTLPLGHHSISKVCGDKNPVKAFSNRKALHMKFVSGKIETRSGFKIAYSTKSKEIGFYSC